MPTPASPSPTSPRPRQLVSPSSPEFITSLAKRTSRGRNKGELLRGLEGSPLSCRASPPPFSLSSPPRSHTSSTVLSPLMPPAPLELVPASPPTGPHALPAFPARHRPQRWCSPRGLSQPICLHRRLRLPAYRYQLLCACCIQHPNCTTHVHPFSVSLL
jgi:hypothetical protein